MSRHELVTGIGLVFVVGLGVAACGDKAATSSSGSASASGSAAAGGKSDAKVASCNNAKKFECVEAAGADQVTQQKQLCDSPDEVFKEEACPKDKALGSCTQIGLKTVHYEGLLSAADLEKNCKEFQGTWAPP